MRTVICAVLFGLLAAFGARLSADEPIALGAERELFCDNYFVASMENAEIRVHQPVRENIAIENDAPWEGNGGGYWSVLYDDREKVYRAYDHAWQIGNGIEPSGPIFIAYYESVDGITWTKPNLGLVEFNGSTENNIMLDKYPDGNGVHDFSPFIDTKPGTPDEERYKATGASLKCNGVWAWKSADGIHWTPMADAPVYAHGAFDSQNCAFWSEREKKYVLHYRAFTDRDGECRIICRATSDDFLHWTDEGEIQYLDGAGPKHAAQFYVNQILPYYRAKNISIGFPARYVDNGLTASTPLLPEWDKRQKRSEASLRHGTVVTDSVYITSRDGKNFRQSNDVFLPPGLRTRHNWSYGDNYIARHAVETDSTKDDMPRELSLYAVESYFTGKTSRLRRYSLRIDGFGSVHAKTLEGTMTTKPFVFDGGELSLNVGTSAAGSVRVEFLDENGAPIPGFTAADSDFFYGDTLDWRATWKGNRDVSSLAGRTVALRFTLREADLYSLKFEKPENSDAK